MAERRPPGFNVDLGFYDSDEVLSIPRKIRAAAIGVWTLCGSYSANKLTDGYVPAEKLKQFGCTPVIRAALMSTKPEPLAIESDEPGGIQLTRWTKWQRTRDEVKAYREADAERKRNERKARRDALTLIDGEMSGRTSDGNPPESPTPKTKTETKTESELPNLLNDEDLRNVGDDVDVAPEHVESLTRRARPYPTSAAKTVVRQVLGSAGYPRTTIDRLAVQVGKLASEGQPDALIRQSLVEWDRREDCAKPEFLPTVLSDVIKKSRAAPGANTSTHARKVNGFLNMPVGQPQRRELEQ